MKFIKIAGIAAVCTAAVLYLALLLILPGAVNLNKLKPDIQKYAHEQADLNLDYNNAALIVTPMLSIGFKADNLSIKLPDNSELFTADFVNAGISLPHLLFKTVKITKAEISNPRLNIDIENGREYKIIKHIEQLSAGQKQEKHPEPSEKQADNNMPFVINIPNFKIQNYSFLINDLKAKNVLKLRGNELVLSYNDGKNASLKTIAELYSNENKNITADIDIDTFLPAGNASIASDTEETQPVNPQFINLPAVYKAYNLKTNIKSKLKIRQKNGKTVSDGYFNADNLSLMLSGVQLPESRIHIKTDNTRIDADSELYIAENEKVSIKTLFDYGKNALLNTSVKSDEIHADNVLMLSKAALDSANIKNELDLYKGGGYFTADAEIKTDFKKLESNGSIEFKDITVKEKNKQQEFLKVNALLLMDNSILKITNTVIEAFGAVFTAEGTVNEKSYADIKAVMKKMPVSNAASMFLPPEMSRAYAFNSGIVNLSADLTGQLNALKGKVNMSLSGLSLTDKANNINYLNNLLSAEIESDFKTFKGTVNNSDFKAYMNGINAVCDKLSMNIDGKDIVINPALVKINGNSSINTAGTIKNYLSSPVFDINSDGRLKAADLKQLLGADFAAYIKASGFLPFVLKASGGASKQSVSVSITADADNYITPADISSILNKKTELKASLDINDDKITIYDTGLLQAGSSVKIADIDGVISRISTKNPVINTLRIKIPNEIDILPVLFKQSKFTADGEIIASGSLNNPDLRGGFNIKNASIPELKLALEKAAAKFEGKNFDLELRKLNADGSDFNIVMSADLTPSSSFVIKTLNIISDFADADKVMKVSEAAGKYTAAPQASSSNASSSASDIPVIIKDGSLDIKELKSGGITLKEISGRISMSKNIFYINNLITSAFKGKMKGSVSSNLVTSEIKADLKGSQMDAAEALLEAAAMKDTITGTLDFDSNLSFRGSSYEEQMKTLKGAVNFTVKDGSLGSIGRIENLLAADNITGSSSLKTLVKTAVSSAVDTSRFSLLKGHLDFNNGIAELNPVTSAGDYMSTYIFGSFDILKNTADLKLRGRLGSAVTGSMGQLAVLNPVNVIKSSSNMNMLFGTLMLSMCEKTSEDEMKLIPPIAKETSDADTAKFQVVLRGDAAQPLKLPRSFKWLASEMQIKEAQAMLAKTPLAPSSLKDAEKQVKDLVKGLTSEGSKQTAEQAEEAVKAVKSILKNIKVKGAE